VPPLDEISRERLLDVFARHFDAGVLKG
jgi:hypothetical protein